MANPKMKKARFIVEFDMPEKATFLTAKAFVHDAVASFSGELNPEHPMARLNNNSVHIYQEHRPRRN